MSLFLTTYDLSKEESSRMLLYGLITVQSLMHMLFTLIGPKGRSKGTTKLDIPQVRFSTIYAAYQIHPPFVIQRSASGKSTGKYFLLLLTLTCASTNNFTLNLRSGIHHK